MTCTGVDPRTNPEDLLIERHRSRSDPNPRPYSILRVDDRVTESLKSSVVLRDLPNNFVSKDTGREYQRLTHPEDTPDNLKHKDCPRVDYDKETPSVTLLVTGRIRYIVYCW